MLPDGAPIVWASRLLGAPLSSRLAGSDLFVAWWQRVRDAHRPVLLVAATEELGRRLQLEHGEARIVVAPMFDASDSEAVSNLATELLGQVESHPTDAIVIGLSMAKTHVLAEMLTASTLPADGAPLVLLLGASAGFHVGLQRRAPRWMQQAGLEWLHRLVSDPRRLAKRYLVDDLVFIRMTWDEWRSRRTTNR